MNIFKHTCTAVVSSIATLATLEIIGSTLDLKEEYFTKDDKIIYKMTAYYKDKHIITDYEELSQVPTETNYQNQFLGQIYEKNNNK